MKSTIGAPEHPAEALTQCTAYGKVDERLRDQLMRCGVPGTRLWVIPGSQEPRGMGHGAVSLGVAMSSTEAIFGYGPRAVSSWTVCWRNDDGTEDSGLYVVTREDAERAWWITDGRGNMLAGGPPIWSKERAGEIAAESGGQIQQGVGR
jgi:hypothetical protein